MLSQRKLAVYDLKYCPITFDFIHFLAAARLYFARLTGSTEFDLLIVADEFRRTSPRDIAFNVQTKDWRLHNLILPILACSPFVHSFTISRARPFETPKDVLTYPPDYSPKEPHSPGYYFGSALNKYYFNSLHPACLQAPANAIFHAKNLFSTTKKKALISPRFSNFEPSRNTKSSHILGIIDRLTKKGFEVGFVHDQEDHGEFSQYITTIPNITLIPEAAFNIPIRLALIEIANVNIFTPCAISGFGAIAKSHPNFICFDMHKPANKSFTGDFNDYELRGGMSPGKTYPYPWSTKNNIFIWDKIFDVDKVVEAAIYVSKFARPDHLRD